MDLVKKNFQLVSCKWNFNNIKELFKHLKNIEDVKKVNKNFKEKKNYSSHAFIVQSRAFAMKRHIK